MYVLRKIVECDILDIMQWCNEQIHILRQKQTIALNAQKKYYDEHVFAEYSKDKPEQILLSFF